MSEMDSDFQDFSVEWALPEHIDSLMIVEDACFVPGIREDRDVFLERLETAHFCNTILKYSGKFENENRNEDKNQNENENQGIFGYFCSEIKNLMPTQTKESFALGHSAKESHDPEGHVLYISSFAIRPDTPEGRGKGLGRFLFRKSLDMILHQNPKIDYIVLIVNEDWKPARRIYETEGFSYTGEIPEFFETEDGKKIAFVMEKKL